MRQRGLSSEGEVDMKKFLTAYDRTKVEDEPLHKDIKNTSEILPIVGADDTGIFRLNGNRYSKAYTLSDINFLAATKEEQKTIITALSDVMNAIPCRFQIVVANEYADDDAVMGKILFKVRGDRYDGIREDYNKIIRDKVSSGKQGLYQTIYLVLTVIADSFRAARAELSSIEYSVRASFITLGISGLSGSLMKALTVNERIGKLYDFMHIGLYSEFKFDFEKELMSKRDWLTTISPAAIRFNNEDFELNGKVGRVMYLSGLPRVMESDIIIRLSRINCLSFVSINAELIETDALKHVIDRKDASVGFKIENQKSARRQNGDYLSDASATLVDKKEALEMFRKEVDSGDDHYFNTTVIILFIADDRAELESITKSIQSAGTMKSVAEIKPCFARQPAGMVSALPLGVQEFKRVTNLSGFCQAMLVPFRTQELHDKDGIYYGVNQISQNVILGNRRLLKNYNGLILGQSGSGKSVFSKSEMISTVAMFPEDQLMVIDPQGEYKGLAKRLGGTVVSFDSGKNLYLNPLDIDFYGLDYSRAQEVIADKADFIISLISSCTRKEFTSEEMSLISRITTRVYSENYTRRYEMNGAEIEEPPFKVPAYMKDKEKATVTKSSLTNAQQIREYSPTMQDIFQGLLDEHSDLGDSLAASLDIFVNGSLNLFSHRTNVSMDNRFIVFDITRLKENLKLTSMLVMLEAVREKIRANAKSGRWTSLYIDEFHELLFVPQVAEFVLKLWKEIRKMNGVLTGITQNMTELIDNDISGRLSGILSNSEFFALLSQSTFDKNALMKFLPSISKALYEYVENAESGTGLIHIGSVTVPFDMRMRKDSAVYGLVNTDSAVGMDI